MEYLKKLLNLEPFSYDYKKRNDIFFKAVIENFNHQLKNSNEYNKWSYLNGIKKYEDIKSLFDLPFFPNSIFKYHNLSSTKKIFKIINSSGTTSQLKSKINLDNHNSKRQTLVLSKILSELLGKKRKPFIIVDKNPQEFKNNFELTARYAGLSGYLLAASSKNYLIKEVNDNSFFEINDIKKMIKFYKSRNERIVIIGYTYLIYDKLLSVLKNNSDILDFPSNTILIHFGGWKKLKDKRVTKNKLNFLVKKYLKIKDNNIIDIYGFSEQLGTIYPSKGQKGCRVPAYSEVVVRSTDNLKPVKDGQIGFLQFISPLATSYPGLSILNDDLGKIVLRNKNCIEFEIIGRPENSLPRGCGDTLPENFLFKNN